MKSFPYLISMLALGLLGSCSEWGESTGSGITEGIENQIPTQSALSEGEMLEVPGGLFLYGTTEAQFSAFLKSYNVHFKGIEETLRKEFIIPVRSVSLETFQMDMFEVTNEQYLEFVQASGYRPEFDENYLKVWDSSSSFPDWAATFPVVWVSQVDAQEYCEWRGKRLPTEEEWEKAARGVDGRVFPWGNRLPETEVANYNKKQLEPIGNRPGDISPYGIYDMAGNAAELTASTHLEGNEAWVVVRGGSFKVVANRIATYSRNVELSENGRAEEIGFRCATNPQ